MYYLLSIINAFDGIASVVLGVIFGILVSSLMLKFIKSLSGDVSWLKMILITISSVVTCILSGIVFGFSGLYQGYGLVVGAVIDRVFGGSWSPVVGAIGMGLMALLPILGNFFIWGTISLMIWFYRHQKTDKKTDMPSLKNTSIWFISLLVTPMCAIGIFLVTISLSNSCTRTISTEFNQFNAHLKNLCVERGDGSECPRNKEELEAFNPESYKMLESCTKMEYVFHENTESSTWYVYTPDGGLIISEEQYYPGFGYLHKKAELESK